MHRVLHTLGIAILIAIVASAAVHAQSPPNVDLDADIGEGRNVVAENPEIAAKLAALADAKRSELGDTELKIKSRGVRDPGRVEPTK